MKNYERPKIEIISLGTDVLSTSNPCVKDTTWEGGTNYDPFFN